MEGRQLALLSSDTVETPRDLQIAVGAVLYFVDNFRASVWSSLTKNSMDVLIGAREAKEFPAAFYAAWNPQNTDEISQKCQVQGVEDARSFSQRLNIPHYIVENQFEEEETNEQYEARLKYAISTLQAGCDLVILPSCVITTVLKCMGVEGPPAMCSLWTFTGNTLTLASCADSFDTLMIQLDLKIDVPKPPEAMEIASQALIEPPKEEAKASQQADPLLSVRLGAIEDWKAAVDDWKAAIEERLKALTTDLNGKSQEAETWKATAARQQEQLDYLNQRATNLETLVQGFKTELNSGLHLQNNALQEVKAEQEKHLTDLDLRFDQIDKSVQELRGNLQPRQPAESRVEARTREETVPRAEEQGQPMIVTILNAGPKEDGRWYASVMATQPCAGYLCVYQQDKMLGYTQEPLNLSSFVQEIDLSALTALQSGQQYQLCVLIDRQKACNEYDLLIPSFHRNFEDTFIFKSCDNLREIEEYLNANHGEAGVQLFRCLAVEWSNEDYDRMQTFVQVIGQYNCDEAATRAGMAAAGIQLS